MTRRLEPIGALFTAELQFRLASAVRLATTLEREPLDIPMQWSHGKHVLRYEELALRQDQADFAAWSLHRSATFLLAVAMKDAIVAAHPDPKSSSDPEIANAYQIARLIRNAFAHSPFDPTWSIDKDCLGRVFAVRNIISLDTNGIQGTRLKWEHYGGPLALLRLSQFVRFEILKQQRTERKVIPLPKRYYYQQGDLILERLERFPDGD
jgi:hypothetical protein